MNRVWLSFMIFSILLVTRVAQTQIISRNDSLRQVFEEKNDSALTKLTAETTISTALKEKAKHKIDSLIRIRDNKDLSPKLRIKAQSSIVFSILYRDTKNSLPEVKKYLDLSMQFRDSIQTLGIAYGFFGYYYKYHELYDSSRYFYEQALIYAIKKNRISNGLSARIDLALVKEKQGLYDQALADYLVILDSCVFYKKRNPEAQCRINIGMLYELKGNYTEALNQMQEALDLCIMNDLGGYMAAVHLSLGNINQAIGEIKMAEDYYIKAIKWSDMLNNSTTKRSTLIQYIHLKAAEKNYQEAITLAHQLFSFEKENGAPSRVAEALFLLADLFDKNNQIELAKQYIQTALDTYQSNYSGRVKKLND